MKTATRSSPVSLRHDTASFLFSAFVVILSAFAGYGLAFLLFSSGGTLSLLPVSPFSGCSTFGEYSLRAAKICRPVLLETAAVFLCAYVDFEKVLLAVVFSLRGLSLGAALYAVTLIPDFSALLFLPLVYAGVTSVFMLLTRFVRRGCGNVPLPQATVYMLLTGGIVSAATLLTTLLFT